METCQIWKVEAMEVQKKYSFLSPVIINFFISDITMQASEEAAVIKVHGHGTKKDLSDRGCREEWCWY